MNADLPGAMGGELCGMLKALTPNATVYIVADEYSVDAERAAWRSGAS